MANTDREITAIKSLQHVSIDRVEVLTDRIESRPSVSNC